MHTARIKLGRISRGALFAVGAVALTECGSYGVPFYGSACLVEGGCALPTDAADEFQWVLPDAGPDAVSDSAAVSDSDSASDSDAVADSASE